MSTGEVSSYYSHSMITENVNAGAHREIIGGMWDEIGRLQFNFMVSNGLRPEHCLLDLGCGSLRGGVKFVPYLDPGHYYGTDINDSLIEAGYEKEIVALGLANRLPRANLVHNGDF